MAASGEAQAGTMTKASKTRKFAAVKRMIKPSDTRIKANLDKAKKREEEDKAAAGPREVDRTPTALFFRHNEQLGPPYHCILDTNFINHCIKHKLDIVKALMDCFLAKCVPVILDSVMAELEKLGSKYRVALRLAKDPRFLRMPGYLDKGTYADDDIVAVAKQHRCFIVCTNDKDLRRRLRKIPGVPIAFVTQHKINVERMAEALGAPRT